MDKDKIVIISTISHKKDMRMLARGKIKNFFEVILKCSPDSCAKRDYKKQYEKALSGEYVCFPGITEKYEMSDFPDLIIDTENNDIEKSFDILILTVHTEQVATVFFLPLLPFGLSFSSIYNNTQ